MHEWESLSHVRWDCKYHKVIAPKYRQKVPYVKLKRDLGKILHDLFQQKGLALLEGHLMADHVRMCLRVPSKHSVAFVIGFLKGKSAVRIHCQAGNKRVTVLHLGQRLLREHCGP